MFQGEGSCWHSGLAAVKWMKSKETEGKEMRQGQSCLTGHD